MGHYLFILNAFPSFLQPLTRKYLRLSSQATVLHLKKFLAKKLSLQDHKDVSDYHFLLNLSIEIF